MKKNVLVIFVVCLFTMFSSLFTGSLVYAEPIEVDTGIDVIFDNDVSVTDKVNTLKEYGYNYSASALGGWLFDVNISGMFSSQRDRLTQADVRNEIEAYAELLLKNGGNKNYYTNNNYNETQNYNVLNNNNMTNNYTSMNYTYNNNTYNYSIDNSKRYYNFTSNSYNFTTTNNNNFTYINNFNNTTIISPSGTTTLYYELPNGSNSLNLTEEDARNGFKTSLSVSSYSNGYDSDDLEFLYHFDNNEYNSAYPKEVNFNLVPNSIQYIESQGGFGQALALSEDINLTIDTNNLFYSFRIYPMIKDKFHLNINGTDIAKRESYIQTTYDYVDWKQTTTGNQYLIVSGQRDSAGCPVLSSSTRESCDYVLIDSYTTDYGTTKRLYSFTAVYRVSTSTTTYPRTYNIINNKLYEDEFCGLLNYNQWNYIAINKNGGVYINGVSTGINIDNTVNLNINIEQDGISYIDELTGFNTNHSHTPTSMPYDSNVYYSLPLYYERVNSHGYIFNQYCSNNINDFVINSAYVTRVNSRFTKTDIRWSGVYNTKQNIIESHKYYIYVDIDSYLNGPGLYWGPYNGATSIHNFITGNNIYSNIFTSNTTTNGYIPAFDNLQPYDFKINKYIFIDLTLMFGDGFEPSIEWCDNNLSTINTYSNNTNVNKSPYDIDTAYVYSEIVDTSYAVNNQLLIQSLIPVSEWKFGGIRPSSPFYGYVYVVVDDYGKILSVQQFNGVEWIEVKSAIYNSALKLWISSIGFNIFFTNWSVMPYDYETNSGIINTLIRFLRDQFDRLIETIKDLTGIGETNIENNIDGSNDIDINVEINNQLNTGLNGLNNLDLENNPSYNLNTNHIDGVTSMGNFIKDTISDVVDSPIGIMWTLPLLLLLLGLVF